jgi:hypothetical protein
MMEEEAMILDGIAQAWAQECDAGKLFRNSADC